MRPSIWSTVFAIPWITREYSQPHCSGGPFAINQAVEFNSCKALDSRASSILLNSDNDSNLRVNIYENEDCTGSVLRSGRECLDLGGLGSSAKSVMVVRGDGEGPVSEQEQLEETHSWSRYSNRVWNTAQQYLLNGVDVVTGYTGNATGRISALVGSGWQKKSGDSEAIGNFVAQLIKTVEGIRNVTVCVETDDGAVYQFKMASQDLG